MGWVTTSYDNETYLTYVGRLETFYDVWRTAGPSNTGDREHDLAELCLDLKAMGPRLNLEILCDGRAAFPGNPPSKDGLTLLHLLSTVERPPSAVDVIFRWLDNQIGADGVRQLALVADRAGRTAVQAACDGSCGILVEYLVRNGCDFSHVKIPPLAQSMQLGRWEFASALLVVVSDQNLVILLQTVAEIIRNPTTLDVLSGRTPIIDFVHRLFRLIGASFDTYWAMRHLLLNYAHFENSSRALVSVEPNGSEEQIGHVFACVAFWELLSGDDRNRSRRAHFLWPPWWAALLRHGAFLFSKYRRAAHAQLASALQTILLPDLLHLVDAYLV
jgi:hypothetical protein